MTDASETRMNTPSPLALIRTDRLVLRTPYRDDAPAVFSIHANPETNQHNPAGPMKDLSEAEQRITEWINIGQNMELVTGASLLWTTHKSSV